MDRLIIIELIQLYVTGCISRQDEQTLKSLMENDKNFPWVELGEYQNLMALLPSILKQETASKRIKDMIVVKMNKLNANESNLQPENKIIEKDWLPVKGSAKKPEPVNKINWETLSTSDTNIKLPAEPDKISFEPHVEKKENEIKSQPHHNFESEDFTRHRRSTESIKIRKDFSALQGLRKYALILGILIISAVIVFTYINLRSDIKIPVTKPAVDKPFNIIDTKLEESGTDTFEVFKIAQDTQTIAKPDSQFEQQTIQEILQPPPPEISKQNETQTAQFAEYTSVEEVSGQEELQLKNETALALSKETNTPVETPTYFVVVEEMPEPIGGLKNIQEKITYPEIARRVGIEGKVFVRAFVDEAGNVTSAEVVKGIGGGCDEAALDAVLDTKFKPGKQRGKPIKVQVIIPIVFRK